MVPNAASPPPQEQHARSPSGERMYKGVRLRKWGRWVAEIRLPNSRERIWLGSYDTPEKAARAFDAAYVCLRGPGCADGLNFPGSPPAVGQTSDPREVYAAAVSYANRMAGAAAAPWEATTEPSEPTPAHDGTPLETAAVLAPAPLKVSAERFDWSELVANPPPLFSPTVVWSHAYLPASLTAAPDFDVEENESGSCPGLWSFDDSGGVPVTDRVDNDRNATRQTPNL